MVSGVEKVLLALLLVVLMFGMGATLSLTHFKDVARRPKGVVIGLLSQFGWMPLIAFALASAFALEPALALSLIVVGTTPGGTTSNLFTYFAGADLALSISMTVVSTIAAIVLMPLLLGVYAGALTDTGIGVPYGSIISTLAVMLVPVALGMTLRAKRPAAAAVAERAGSIAGIVVLLVLVVTGVVKNHALFAQIPAGGYVAAVALGVVGMVLGWSVAWAARLAHPQRVAVALETGIQNSPLAIGVIALSFPAELVDPMLRLPLMYALFVLLTATLATLVFRRVAKG